MPKPVVFQYPKCTTCRKALRYLEEKGVSYESVDITLHPPSRAQLSAAIKLSGLPVKRFFNTSGQSYRDGKFGERLASMSESDAVQALANDGKLIKRPLVLGAGFVLVGFDPGAYCERFG